MAFNNEIEKTEGEIKVLQAKLELLKELEKHKTPCEEAYKRVYGYYPSTNPSVSNYEDTRWSAFQFGYNQAQKDYKVGEYQETAQERGERLHKDVERIVRENKKWCEEHPDKDPLDWLKPQTPEQVADGLKEAFREAVKQGVVSSSTKPQTLYDVIADWWEYLEDTLDMDSSIKDLVNDIEEWLPKEQSAAGSQNAYVECSVEGFNDCLNKIKGKLK